MKTKADSCMGKRQPDMRMIGLGICVFLLLSALLLANGMSKPLSRDEEMYCTAGVLMAQGKEIYRDFSYVSQLPYHPLLLAGLYRASGSTHYLLLARLVTVVCEMLTMICVWATCQHLLRQFPRTATAVGIMAMVFYAANPLVYMANGYAWNHGVVVFLVVLSLYLFLTCPAGAHAQRVRFFLLGMCLTAATCMRITTALIQLVFVVVIAFNSKVPRREIIRSVSSFVGGVVIALVWPLYTIVRAGDAFWLNLVEIPRIYGSYLRDSGASVGKIDITLACLVQPGYLALLAAVGFAWFQARRTELPGPDKRQTLVYLVCAACFVIAFIPPTLWRQYLAVPVPFLCLTLVVSFCRLCRGAARGSDRPFRKTIKATVVCAFIALIVHFATLLRHPPPFRPVDWEPLKLYKTSQTLARSIPGRGPVLTLAPLYALEGGRTIYPELACGAIVFRIGDLLSQQQRSRARVVGPSTLTELTERTHPAAVLLGAETPGYEAPLRALLDPSWQSVSLENGMELRLPPVQ